MTNLEVREKEVKRRREKLGSRYFCIIWLWDYTFINLFFLLNITGQVRIKPWLSLRLKIKTLLTEISWDSYLYSAITVIKNWRSSREYKNIINKYGYKVIESDVSSQQSTINFGPITIYLEQAEQPEKVAKIRDVWFWWPKI